MAYLLEERIEIVRHIKQNWQSPITQTASIKQIQQIIAMDFFSEKYEFEPVFSMHKWCVMSTFRRAG